MQSIKRNQPFSYFCQITAISALFVASLACGSSVAKSTPTPRPTPTQIPTPVFVQFEDLDSHAGDHVIVEGYISVGVVVTCMSPQDICYLPLSQTQQDKPTLLIAIHTPHSGGANTMRPLPRDEPLDKTKIIVLCDDLQQAHQGDLIRVTGWLRKSEQRLSGIAEGSPLIRIEMVELVTND